ncbi:hypothetical protein OL229_19185 [Neisseriaceae bacterium JH1-16]|nr:hypothetical protein [Neisseriaceae bacterium JH1-16]
MSDYRSTSQPVSTVATLMAMTEDAGLLIQVLAFRQRPDDSAPLPLPAFATLARAPELIERDYPMLERNEAIAKDIDAAAIAWVTGLHGEPLLALKSTGKLLGMSAHRKRSACKTLASPLTA